MGFSEPNAALPLHDCMSEASETKTCPFCGETIKSVAIRCKHCHADLSKVGTEPDFDRGVHPKTRPSEEADKAAAAERAGTVRQLSPEEFEHRFLEFAYKAVGRIDAASVAYAVKCPIKQAEDMLEDLAARDVIIREVDDDGFVHFRLPGRATPQPQPPPQFTPAQRSPTPPPPQALVPLHSPGPLTPIGPPSHANAVAGLVVNLFLPGVGSLIAGRTSEGVGQVVLFAISLPLMFVLIGFPLLLAAWIWALVTGIRAVHETNPAH
jgi:TM2 domain-containing membrane protein YozV